jgi:hypothetical protein
MITRNVTFTLPSYSKSTYKHCGHTHTRPIMPISHRGSQTELEVSSPIDPLPTHLNYEQSLFFPTEAATLKLLQSHQSSSLATERQTAISANEEATRYAST